MATTRADTLDASYSDFGAKSVDLAAPGTAIYSTWCTNSAAPGSSDRAYTYLSGTSMAAPHGMFAFVDPQFQTVFNSDMPNSFLPNAIVCPYWDSLDTLFGGGVYAGIVGTAPARRLVISWVNVPRTFSFKLPLTFQAVIEEETNRILFQYREVHPENRDGGGRQASIGVENETGRLAAKYTYNGSPSIVTNGQAIQFVPAFSGSMVVTPGSGLEVSGRFGGPFAPENLTYTIENTGQAGFNWAAAKTQEWISLSATNGLLAPGQSTNVLVALNTKALALKTGSYLEVISFFNLKNGNGNTTRAVALTVSGTNSVLAVTPDLDWRASGPPGGPFNPASQIYTLMNSGDARLDWTANRSHDWISLSSSNGILRPGESTVVTFSIGPAATNLPPTSYAGRVDFVNSTSGLGNVSRSVRLFIAQRPSLAVLTDTTQDRLSLRLNGDAGQSCVIETSTNLLKWVPLLTNALAPGGWLDFTDMPSSQVPRRFYRGKCSRRKVGRLGRLPPQLEV